MHHSTTCFRKVLMRLFKFWTDLVIFSGTFIWMNWQTLAILTWVFGWYFLRNILATSGKTTDIACCQWQNSSLQEIFFFYCEHDSFPILKWILFLQFKTLCFFMVSDKRIFLITWKKCLNTALFQFPISIKTGFSWYISNMLQ